MPPASIPASGPRRAIVVDDSRAMRVLLRKALEERGFSVSEAGDGREALARLEQMEPPDLALIDWNMPEMDGLELISLLRKSPRFDGMAMVMVTSESEPARIEQALRAGADDYIMKPLSAEVLRERLMLLEEEISR